MVPQPRTARGTFQSQAPALQRFAAKCRFDATTGCVLWTGGRTGGKANSAVYGSFWDGGRRWFAHRWAGIHIHGLDLTGVTAGHCCPCGPNTLCVEHVRGETIAEGNAEKWQRYRETQTATQRQFWLFVSLGIEQLEPQPAPLADNDQIPFYEPPAWLRPYLPAPARECPF